MSSPPEAVRPEWRSALRWRRAAATHGLWWGPTGLWDAGPADDRAHGAAAAPEAPNAQDAQDAPDAPEARRYADFESWCQAHGGRRARLWLSSWWVCDLLVDPALPLADDAAVLAYARPLLQHYHGDGARGWSLAAWQSGPQRGVSALRGQALAPLQASAARHGVQLLQVQPWWARVLALLDEAGTPFTSPPPTGLLLVEGTLISCLQLHTGRVQALQQRRLERGDRAALRAWLADQTGADPAPPAAGLPVGPSPGPAAPAAAAGRTLLLGWGLDDDAADAEWPMGVRQIGRVDGARPDPRWWRGPAGTAQRAQAG